MQYDFENLIKRYLPIALIVALFSEIHFYPLGGTLRLSIGVVLIHLVGLTKKDICLPSLTILSGLIIGIERYITQTIVFMRSPEQAFQFVEPSLLYYGCFAILYGSIKLYERRNTMFTAILIMSSIDALSNSVEALLRHDSNTRLLQIVLLAGVLRAVIAYVIFMLWERQSLFIQKQEHQKRYVELTSMAANVETGLFYLKKSSNEIEDVMQKSYTLYDTLPENLPSKANALEIAREIHEIKKDYLRILSGFDDFIRKTENMNALSLSDILAIVSSSTEKSIKTSGKDIRLTIEQSGNTFVSHSLNIFSILNNLIDNSIGAIDEKGHIHIDAVYDNQQLKLTVKDDGTGISESLKSVVFNPGFTTKYDPVTGKASTGIGLSHVQNLVLGMQGHIELNSTPENGTIFNITLPTHREEDTDETHTHN